MGGAACVMPGLPCAFIIFVHSIPLVMSFCTALILEEKRSDQSASFPAMPDALFPR
jgi:hypothetical protein